MKDRERKRKRESQNSRSTYYTTRETERAARHLFNTTSGGFYSDVSLSPHTGPREQIHAESFSTRHDAHMHTHTPYSIHTPSLHPPFSLHLTLLHENPQLKPTFKSRQYQYFEAHFILSVSIDLHKLNVSATSSSFFLLIDLTKLSIPPEDRHLILFSI